MRDERGGDGRRRIGWIGLIVLIFGVPVVSHLACAGANGGERTQASGARTAATANTTSQRPNILFIITDDQRYDAVGVVQREEGERSRWPWFKTPNMDRLASEGARFRNAFVVHSLCSPSRATFLTSRYSHETGVIANDSPMPLNVTSWATELAKAGYATAYFGKWHMGKQVERPGFATFASFIGQGVYDNCEFNVDGKMIKSSGWVDDITTDYAIHFLESHQSGGSPFAAVVGYKSPHDPRKPAARHAKDYADETLRRPVNDVERSPAPFIDVYLGGKPRKPYDPKEADHLNYFRCLEGVDDNVGRLLDALDRLHLTEDTFICFVGDNGFYLGEHGLGDKRTVYEESLRIPMIVRYPRMVKAGTLIDATALNLDFAPTLLDLAGVPTPPPMRGRSWRPLFAGTTPSDWRTEFLCENFRDPVYPKVTFPLVGLRTNEMKYVEYPEHPEWQQLFDLDRDHYEMNNLATDPASASALAKMREELENQKQATGFKWP